MQYLAEVEKKSGGLLGGSKTALRLLACQKGPDEGWKALTGDSNIVYTDKAGDRGSGALVLAELSGNDVRRVQSATRDIINILRTHATLQGKLKGKDEDIEQWKESLTYQSQMLNQREVELQQREEQVQQMDEEVARLEQQREEVNSMRNEAQRLRAELEEKQAAIDEAWANVQNQSSGGGGLLDEEQVSLLQSQLDALSGSMATAEGLQGRMYGITEQVNGQQPVLDEYWQLADQAGQGSQDHRDGSTAEQLASLRSHWQSWHEGQSALAQMQAEADGLRRELRTKQQYSDTLQRQLKAQQLLQKQLAHLAGGLDPEISRQIDYEALDNMPLGELETKVQDLRRDYDRTYNFVNDQEEELRLQLQAIEAIQVRMGEASEFDRLTLSTELADEQDSYRILDESMVDQRRTLHERLTILEQHQTILARRQGRAHPEGGEQRNAADLAPVLAQLEADAAQQKQQLDHVNGELQEMEVKLRELAGKIEAKTSEQRAVKEELDKFDAAFQAGLGGGGGGLGDAYRAVLHPVQDFLNGLKQQLHEAMGEMNHLLELERQQQQLVHAMRQSIGEMRQPGGSNAGTADHANPFSDAA
ncbi:MAG: hypothetical protein HC824_04305 [Synechococcales cyanobacterium RM1_1_8]|nr:hypothetical protein [Synechococcales cyanobacterium RM1_1_8]